MSYHSELTPEAKEALQKHKTVSTITSLLIAVIVLALICGVLAMLNIIIPGRKIDTIISYTAPSVEEAVDNQPKVQVNQRQTVTQSAASSSVAKVITSASVSSVSIPTADSFTSVESVEFGSVDDFGFDSGFEGDFGSETSFFGSQVKGSRIAFVIDYSASMKSKGRDPLMRAELQKSVEGLRGGNADFSLIFFSGPVWKAGDTVTPPGKGKVKTVTDEAGKEYVWRTIDGLPTPNKTRKIDWIDAAPKNIDKAVRDIQETPLIFGTNWRPPLEMAINMKPAPDVIVFMTDGATHDAEGVAKDMGALASKKGIIINSISLLEPDAKEGMILLAESTGGTATLVKSADEIIDLISGDNL